MTRVVHFELGLPDPDSAIGFYEQVFDWKIEKWSGPQEYWQVTTGDEASQPVSTAVWRGRTTVSRERQYHRRTLGGRVHDRVTQAGGSSRCRKPLPELTGSPTAHPQGMLFGIFRETPRRNRRAPSGISPPGAGAAASWRVEHRIQNAVVADAAARRRVQIDIGDDHGLASVGRAGQDLAGVIRDAPTRP